MNQHLSMRSGNPALSSKTFTNINREASEKMTIEGTVNKTAMSLLLLMATASYTWMNPSPGLMILGFIGGFIMAIITIFKKTWAPYTVSGYALLEGLALGGVSRIFEMKYPGIASQAIFLTFGILAALLLASAIIFLVSPGNELAAVAIFNTAGWNYYGPACAMSVTILLIVFAVMGGMWWMERHGPTWAQLGANMTGRT